MINNLCVELRRKALTSDITQRLHLTIPFDRRTNLLRTCTTFEIFIYPISEVKDMYLASP